MPRIAPGNVPFEIRSDGGTVVNNGPGTVVYGDEQHVSAAVNDGTLTPGQTMTLDGAAWFLAVNQSADVDVSSPATAGGFRPADVGRGGSTPLTAGLVVTDSTAQTDNHQFMLGPRTTGLTWPVPTFQPVVAAKQIALDIAPSAGAVAGTNGLAWIDVCDTPIIDDTAGNLASLRLGMFSGKAEVSTRVFGTGAMADMAIGTVMQTDTQIPQIYLVKPTNKTLDGTFRPTVPGRVHLGYDGSSVRIGNGLSLAVGSAFGHVYLPAIAGTPTGSPPNSAALVPMVVDPANLKLWGLFPGGWKSVTFA